MSLGFLHPDKNFLLSPLGGETEGVPIIESKVSPIGGDLEGTESSPIPKIIHYCWFGRKPLTKLAKKCIASWIKFFPDYEIIEWNENNFDVNIIPYTRESYKIGKYAFVSDYARYWILYHYGGLYFDTDVEVIRPFDSIIKKGPFLGIEKSKFKLLVNPGLGMSANKNMRYHKEILNIYEKWEFNKNNKEINAILLKETTFLLEKFGFNKTNELQKIAGITIYPNEYFNPKDDYTGRIYITNNTHSIHHYAKSWVENYGPIRNYLTQFYHRIISLL